MAMVVWRRKYSSSSVYWRKKCWASGRSMRQMLPTEAAAERMLTSRSIMNTKCWLSSWAFSPLGGTYCRPRVVMM